MNVKESTAGLPTSSTRSTSTSPATNSQTNTRKPSISCSTRSLFRTLSPQARHINAIAHNDVLLGTGWNYYGQLATDDQKTRFLPISLSLPFSKEDTIKSVVCGGFHACVLTRSGKVYSCGHGAIGQLGHGDREHVRSLKLIESLADERQVIKRVALGGFHSLFLSESGQVYSCGQCSEGQAGIDQATPVLRPTEIPEFKNITIKYVACGWSSSFAVDVNGNVWTWGLNDHYQLGIQDSTCVKSPVLLPKSRFVGYYSSHSHKLDIARIVSSEVHTAFITYSGHVYTCGLNDKYQLGYPDTDDTRIHFPAAPAMCQDKPRLIEKLSHVKVVQAALTRNTSTFLTADGQLFFCGYEPEAMSTSVAMLTSVPAMSQASTLLHDPYGAYLSRFSSNRDETPSDQQEIASISSYASQSPVLLHINLQKNEKVVRITSGLKHTMCLTNSGSAFGFGVPSLGRLGIGMQHSFIDVPTKIPLNISKERYHSLIPLTGSNTPQFSIRSAPNSFTESPPMSPSFITFQYSSPTSEANSPVISLHSEFGGELCRRNRKSPLEEYHWSISNFSAGSSFSLFQTGKAPLSPLHAVVQEDFDSLYLWDAAFSSMTSIMFTECRKDKRQFLDVLVLFK